MNLNEENNQSDKEKNPFSLPGDYFSAFSKKMMLKIELTDELKEFKLLSSIDKKLPFVTPENYFETKSELAQYPALLSLKNKNVFEVPENYFEAAAKNVQNKLEVIEELKTYPSVSSISKQNNFVVPDVYFDNLSEQLISELSDERQNGYGRIIQLVFSKKTAYALAAMLVISFGLYFYNTKTEAASTDCNTLACLDKNEIIKANQINNFDDEALMEMVNTDDLSKNLNNKLKEENKDDNQQATEEFVLENVDVNDITDEI